LKKDLIIWGATGQCIVLEEFLNKDYNIVALFDKNENIDSPFNNVPIFHNEEFFFHFCGTKENLHFIVAIGGNNGNLRRGISQDLIQKKLIPITAIHPKANIASNAMIGLGSQILIGATIAAKATIGDYCIVNSSASIDHECNIADGVHIAPGVTLAGCVRIGENSFIGTNATILPRVTIGKNTLIGAGAVVTKNITANCVAYGVPAMVVKQNLKKK
jgi:sugar O-acyltransferase (sialic acid O-acetyltransferase NeuD family)